MFIDPIAGGAMANVITQLHQKFSSWLVRPLPGGRLVRAGLSHASFPLRRIPP